jgi:hypothetical protein
MTDLRRAALLAACLILAAACKQPPVDLPIKGVPFTDSLYGATVVRVTDKTIDGYSGPGIENEYARSDAENCDGTRLILRGQDGEWYLYDRLSYQMLKRFTDIGLGEEPEPRWDPTAPNIFCHIYGSELRRYDITNDSSTTIHDFKVEYPQASFISTKTEGEPSLDGRYWCFMVEDSVYNTLAVIVYDRDTDSIIGTKTQFPDGINWVSMDMSGTHCVVGYESRACQAFPADLSRTVEMPSGASGHMDMALTADSTSVIVYQSNTTDWIAIADLDSGIEIPLVEIPFNVSTDIGLHFSGNCADAPGWCLVSTYGAVNPSSGESHSWMDNLLFMVELKASPRIVKLAQTRCYTGRSPQSNYFAEAYAAINRAGTRVVYGSNWGDFSVPDYTDAYEVTLPAGWNH